MTAVSVALFYFFVYIDITKDRGIWDESAEWNRHSASTTDTIDLASEKTSQLGLQAT